MFRSGAGKRRREEKRRARDAFQRDTDADWRVIGRDSPFWGVLTQDEFLPDRLTDTSIEDFYAWGRRDVAFVTGLLKQACGSAPSGGRALDFGCGCGRLSEAMAEMVDQVVGVDVSPGMLEIARGRSGRVEYRADIPAGSRFDWVNSIMVFQHIPPARGLETLGSLLAALSPGGVISIHIQFEADIPLADDYERDAKAGTMMCYSYDLNRVFGLLNASGIEAYLLWPTDHGGNKGFIICGRRRDR